MSKTGQREGVVVSDWQAKREEAVQADYLLELPCLVFVNTIYSGVLGSLGALGRGETEEDWA